MFSRHDLLVSMLAVLSLATSACNGGGGGGDDDDDDDGSSLTIPNPDVSFGGGDGIVVSGEPATVYGVAFQDDGKILVCGSVIGPADDLDIFVLRLNADGSTDTAFGDAGRVVVHASALDDYGFDITTLGDGRVVVVGASGLQFLNGGDITVVLLGTDGTPDATFDGDGILVIDTPNAAYAKAVTVDASDRIVLAGTIFNTDDDVVVARLDDAGVLDATFSGDGSIIDNQGSFERGEAIAIAPGGEIVVGGGYEARLYRFLANGDPDNTFSGNGNLPLADPLDIVYDLAVQADGAVVLVGVDDEVVDPILAVVARVTQTGLLETAFGTDGYRTLYEGVANQVDVASDGRIYIGGQILATPQLTRLSSAGIPDATWGSGGTLSFDDITFTLAVGFGTRLDADDKPVFAGTLVPELVPIVFRVQP